MQLIIPAFNEEGRLPATLRALRAYALSTAALPRPPLEVLVVDNASTDRTAEVARALDSTWLTLVDLGPVTEDLRHWRPTASAWIVVLGDVMTVLLVCVSIWHTSGRSARTRQ